MRSGQMDMSPLNQPARLGTSNRRRRSLLVVAVFVPLPVLALLWWSPNSAQPSPLPQPRGGEDVLVSGESLTELKIPGTEPRTGVREHSMETSMPLQQVALPPEHSEAGFHRHRPFPDALTCADSLVFNPNGTALDGDSLVRLDAMLGEMNQRILAHEEAKAVLAREWANTRIELGQFKFIPPDRATLPAAAGAIRVIVNDPQAGPPMLVDVFPGECAELDVASSDIEQEVASARASIQTYFATLSTGTKPNRNNK